MLNLKGVIGMANEDGKFWIDEENNELVLADDEGEQRFVIEEDFEIEGTKYLILLDADDDEAEGLPVKLITNGEEEILAPVEDDAEFEKVKEKYLSI